ncbi:hypothetical protein pb186bvf_020154 [Paramecium bursaria]
MSEIILYIFRDGQETGETISAQQDSRLEQALRGIRQKYDFQFDEQELISLDLNLISNQPSYQFDGVCLSFILNLYDEQRQDQQSDTNYQENQQIQLVQNNIGNLNDRIIRWNEIVIFFNPNGQQIKFLFFEPFQAEGVLEMKDGLFQNNFQGENFQDIFEYQICHLESGFAIKWQNNSYSQLNELKNDKFNHKI